MKHRFGIIGLGEAGYAIGAGLVAAGAESVHGFDVRNEPAVLQRARDAGIIVSGSLQEMVKATEILLCLTSAKSALAIAESVSPLLGTEHLYSDWNSASPQLKRDVADVICRSGALFVDGAVMAAVPPQRHRVPVLLSGNGAEELVRSTVGLDMRLTSLGSEPGQASAVKMFRSLLVKGLEALIIECITGAHRYGATEMVLTSMNGSLPTDDWNELASYLVMRSVEHGARRAEELRQAGATLDEAGVEPLLADAGAKRLQWFADQAIRKDSVHDYKDVLAALAVDSTHA